TRIDLPCAPVQKPSSAEACHTCALALPAEDLLYEDSSHRRKGPRIACEEQTELEWNTEHPLPQGYVGEDVHRQVRGRPAHPSCVARWAHAALLARQRDQHVLATRPTSRAQESMRQNSAFQIFA